jgi:hypothetical protein
MNLGKLSFPLDPQDFGTTLVPLDPARHVLAELFKAAINAEFTAVWRKVTTRSLSDTLPVADTLEMEPSIQVMQQRKAVFPLLCVHRTGTANLDQITLFEDRLTQQWAVDYILGPLDVGDARKLQDICLAITKLIRLVVRQRGHAAYQSGALQFFHDTAQLASIEVKSIEGPGQASFVGDPKSTLYYAVTVMIETTEITGDDPDFYGPLQATDFDIGLGNDADIIHGLLYAGTDQSG